MIHDAAGTLSRPPRLRDAGEPAGHSHHPVPRETHPPCRERNIRELLQVPALDEARRRGFDVTGPVPPDTAFTPARRKEFDAVICMYHDQGHIPVKALAFDCAVNTTLGLPVQRTSVDHGTAFDIAWQGKANPGSLFSAVRLAVKLSRP